MINLPIRDLRELLIKWNSSSVLIQSYLHKGLFVGVHVCNNFEDEHVIYVLDVVILRLVSSYDLIGVSLKLTNFNVTCIDVDENEVERVIFLQEYCMLTYSLQHDEFRGWSKELKTAYINFIGCLLKDYYILNVLYELDIESAYSSYLCSSSQLRKLINDKEYVIYEVEQAIDKLTNKYPLKFLYRNN